MPGSIVMNVAMAWQYWNTVNLLTATFLLFWLMRSLRNLYRAFKVRAALITGRVVQVRGLSSYLHYLEGATPSHASHVMHTRQVEPPSGVPSLYNPVTVGSVSVSVVDADQSFNRKLRYHVELSTPVPCKVMALTDFFPGTFKRKVDDPGFGNGGATAASGRSRSNSRSNLKGGTSVGGRSRSNSRSSLAGDAWLETLQTEDMAAGGVGMGVHGLFERSKVCYSSSKLMEVQPGVHSIELETLMLNLDRYVAPQVVVPPTPPTAAPSTEAAGAGEGDVALMEEGATPKPDKPHPPKVSPPPSEVLFGLLIVPEGPLDVDVNISDAEVSYELSKDETDVVPTPTTTTTTGGGGGKAETFAGDAISTVIGGDDTGASSAAAGGAPGGGHRRVRDRPFLNLLRGLVGVHVPHEETGGAFPYFAEDPQNIPPGANVGTSRVGNDAGASENNGMTIAASDGLTGGKLSAIRERKKLMAGEAVDPSFSMLVMGGSVRTLMEVAQNSRNEQGAAKPAIAKAGQDAPKTKVDLSSKEYLLGANGICYTNLEIFGLQSELNSTSFMEMTVLNQEKEGGTTKIKYEGDKSDSGGFEDDCVICMCEEKTVMLLPCRHFCVCPTCLVKIDKCPVCRAAFEEYVVITKGDKTGSEMTVPIVGGSGVRKRKAPVIN